MPSPHAHTDEPERQLCGAEPDVERLSAELKEQVRLAKARISERLREQRSPELGKGSA
jgi:hypothetical protein